MLHRRWRAFTHEAPDTGRGLGLGHRRRMASGVCVNVGLMTNTTDGPSPTVLSSKAAALIPMTYDLKASDPIIHTVRRIATVEELIDAQLRLIALCLVQAQVSDPSERGTTVARAVSEIAVGYVRGYREYDEKPKALAAHIAPKYADEDRTLAGWKEAWKKAQSSTGARRVPASELPKLYADLVVLCDQSFEDGIEVDAWARNHVVGLGEEPAVWSATSAYGEKGWKIRRVPDRSVALPYVVLD